MNLEKSDDLNQDTVAIKKKKMTVISFQFHKGTIRTLYAQRMIANDANFNSIKVQLERHIPSWHRIDPQQISIP